MEKLTTTEISKYNLHTVKLKFSFISESIEGKIVTQDNGIYFVHNYSNLNGGKPREMFGYQYGWCIGQKEGYKLSYDIYLVEEMEPSTPAKETKPTGLQEERAKLVARIAEIDQALEEDREEDYPEELF